MYVYYIYIYIYIHIYMVIYYLEGHRAGAPSLELRHVQRAGAAAPAALGREDDTVGNPRSNFSIRAFRAQISQFELFELILLSKLNKQLSVERFEATASQSRIL